MHLTSVIIYNVSKMAPQELLYYFYAKKKKKFKLMAVKIMLIKYFSNPQIVTESLHLVDCNSCLYV